MNNEGRSVEGMNGTRASDIPQPSVRRRSGQLVMVAAMAMPGPTELVILGFVLIGPVTVALVILYFTLWRPRHRPPARGFDVAPPPPVPRRADPPA